MKRLIVLVMVSVVALNAGPAIGDTRTFSDGRDEPDSLLDIKEVRHSHDGNHLVHRVKTYDEWQKKDLKNRAIYIDIDLPDSGGLSNFFYVYIAYRSGQLKAKLYNNSGDPPRFVANLPVHRPNDKSVEIEIKRGYLDRNMDRYKWRAVTNDEATSGCSEDNCIDGEPNHGWHEHNDL